MRTRNIGNAGLAAILLAALWVTGCRETAPLVPDVLVPDRYASGDGQADFAGETLPRPFMVLLEGPVQPGMLGGRGSRPAIKGERVRFEVENPDTGAVFTDSGAAVYETLTDAGGAALAALRLGPWSGDVWVTASLPEYPAVMPVRLRAISGVRRIGEDLEAVTDGVIDEVGVELRGPDGAPVPGVEVYFRPEGGVDAGGSLKHYRVVSDENGRAVTSWRMGSDVKRYFANVQIHDVREGLPLRERFDVASISFEAMAMNRTQLLTVLCGGLAVFVFGMTLMSRGLQRIADRRLRSALHLMAKNRFMGMLTGTLVTGLIQSSSATTVMLIGFVNAGMLSLVQGISVVFGANIGTTITAQMIAFRLDDLAYPAIAIGLVIATVVKKPQLRAFGKAMLGFGLLFLGMTTMSDILKPLRYSPAFISWFAYFDCTPEGPFGLMPLWPTFMCIVVGTVTTCIIQSSSAAMGIVLALCSQGLLNFYTAVPIMLGLDIGTTITANLAALNANRDAKRVALAHTFFNLFGAASMFLLFYVPLWQGQPLFLGFVDWLTPGDVFSAHPENLLRHVANAHSLFNIVSAVLFLPFTGALARFCMRVIPSGASATGSMLQYLEPKLLLSPAIALSQAVYELVYMLRQGQDSLNESCELLCNNREALADSILRREDKIDRLQKEIIEYLMDLSRSDVTPDQSAIISPLIHVINDAERIGDHAESLVKIHNTLKILNHTLSKEAVEGITSIQRCLNKQFAAIYAVLEGEDVQAGRRALEAEDELSEVLQQSINNKIRRMDERQCDVQPGVVYLDALAHLERVGDHLVNVAERSGDILRVTNG